MEILTKSNIHSKNESNRDSICDIQSSLSPSTFGSAKPKFSPRSREDPYRPEVIEVSLSVEVSNPKGRKTEKLTSTIKPSPSTKLLKKSISKQSLDDSLNFNTSVYKDPTTTKN
jgi:hypothetical protein